jgi:broad specificity phosphatase PhoE
MITLWLMRHGEQIKQKDWRKHGGVWQPNAPLSEKGERTIDRVRAAYLDRVKFDKVYSSTLRRAALTANRAVPVGTAITLTPDLAPGYTADWDALFEQLNPTNYPATLAQLRALDSGLMQREKLHVVRGIFKILRESLKLDTSGSSHSLLVSHEPLITLAREYFFSDILEFCPPLGKGGIFRMYFERIRPIWFDLLSQLPA